MLANGATAALELARIAYGVNLDSKEELNEHLRKVYRPFDPDIYTAWSLAFDKAIAAVRLPDRALEEGRLPGVPVVYLTAVLGLIALALQRRPLTTYHLCWLGMLLFLAFIFALTGSNMGRFRIAFEPFWFLYSFALLDVLLSVPWPRRELLEQPAAA